MNQHDQFKCKAFLIATTKRQHSSPFHLPSHSFVPFSNKNPHITSCTTISSFIKEIIDMSKKSNKSKAEVDYELKEWKYLLPRPQSRDQNLDVEKFFSIGFNLMSKDRAERNQEVIRKLATEEGLAAIRKLFDGLIHTRSTASSRYFNKSVIPFFQTITFSKIESSLVLENQLGTIYNFLYGPNDNRAIAIFPIIITHLKELTEDADQQDPRISPVMIRLSVFEKIVEWNQTAQANPEFTNIATDFTSCIPGHCLHSASRSLGRINQRLGLADALPSNTTIKHESVFSQNQFILHQDHPGELSPLGPRHGNEFVDITKIKILPIMDDILSERPEYLPLSDPKTLHLPGLAGLIDRQFRLL